MTVKTLFALIFVMCASIPGYGASNPGSWDSGYTAETATGLVGGIRVDAVTTSSSAILGLSPNHFGVHWDADYALGDSVLGLTVGHVNAGDEMHFTFESPLLGGTVLYIENFDSNSAATITAEGATGITVKSSSMVSYAATNAASGLLTSSNPGYDGNGDIALVLDGDVTKISLDYTGGDGANGVFYAFSSPASHAVPEPTSGLVMASLFVMGGSLLYWRRKYRA